MKREQQKLGTYDPTPELLEKQLAKVRAADLVVMQEELRRRKEVFSPEWAAAQVIVVIENFEMIETSSQPHYVSLISLAFTLTKGIFR